MPNPITAALSTTASAEKPQAKPRAEDAQKAEASFQSVLDQHPDHHTESIEMIDLTTPEPAAPEPEGDPLPEETDLPDQEAVHGVTERPGQSEATPTDASHQAHAIAPPVVVLASSDGPTEGTLAATIQTPIQPRALNQPQAALVAPKVSGSVPTAKEQRQTGQETEPNIKGTRPLPDAEDVPDRAAVIRDPSPVSAAPKPAPTMVQMQLLASEKQANPADSAERSEPDEARAIRDVQTTAPAREATMTQQPMTAAARTEMARAIAGQMAAVIHARPQSGAVEVALNPEELGRVSIVLNGREDGFQITIAAERPETLDIMRRHIAVLEAEFRNLGLGHLSVDLGSSSDTHREAEKEGNSSNSDPQQIEHTVTTLSAAPRIGASGRIDIRL